MLWDRLVTSIIAPQRDLYVRTHGEPPTTEGGHPLRVVILGYAGMRSAKRVQEIRVQDQTAESPIQREDYKFFPPEVMKGEADRDTGLTIDAKTLNSAICEPQRGARFKAGALTLRGWAAASERPRRRALSPPNGSGCAEEHYSNRSQ